MHTASPSPRFSLTAQPLPPQGDPGSAVEPSPRTATFGPFSLDLTTGELHRGARAVPLPRQSYQVLRRLLESSGQLVTREELRDELWPDGTCVDFEHGLHAAVHRLRMAIRIPRSRRPFVETLPGRGYRWNGEVMLAGDRAGDGSARCEREERARFHLAHRGPHHLRRALDLFGGLAAESPRSASAAAGLATAWTLAADFGLCPVAEGLARAEAEAGRALALDPACAEARAALGFVKHRGQRDWAGAEADYRRAVHGAPHDVRVRQRYAEFLSQQGRHPEAIEQIEAARAKDPLDRVAATSHAWILYHARDWRGARETCDAVLELDPGWELARFVLGRVELAAGRSAEAAFLLEPLGPSPWIAATLALAHADQGNPGGVARAAGLMAHPETPPYLLAKLLLAEGDREGALDRLERSVRTRDVWLCDARVDPELDPLRGHPRFREICARLGAG